MNNYSFHIMPEIASNFAFEVDLLYGFLVVVSIFFTILISALVLGFSIYYRRGQRVNRTLGHHSNFTEVIWASVPFVLVMIMFAWGAVLFYKIQTPPENTLDIQVVGKQWMWKIQHPGGRQEINSLHVPLGQPVRLRMISEDVIHSFFVPAFRVKQDLLPGYYTQMWFEPTKTGTYHLFCAEYCGTEHSLMIGSVVVMEPEDYSKWVSEGVPVTPEQHGEQLFTKFNCTSCHDQSSSAYGPSLVGIYGQNRPLKNGRVVLADEQYLRDSIFNPTKHNLAGYDVLMSKPDGMTEEEAMAIVSYLKSTSRSPVEQPQVALQNSK